MTPPRNEDLAKLLADIHSDEREWNTTCHASRQLQRLIAYLEGKGDQGLYPEYDALDKAEDAATEAWKAMHP